MTRRHLFTSESVTEGHPDKLADQISDAVLDEVLRNEEDPSFSRVACETLVTTGLVIVAGEIRTETYIDVPSLVRQTVSKIGYTDSRFGIDGETCGVITAIQPQSADIARGVDEAIEHRDRKQADALDQIGAGDQGMMFGFACTETPELMPLPIAMAHRVAERLAAVRKDGTLDYLRPDGKSQVTIEYEGNTPVRVDTVLISAQHSDTTDMAQMDVEVRDNVIMPVLQGYDIDHTDVRTLVNPTGRFVTGGPKGDTGLTGRKIIVDSYGGTAPQGGGCFSGKDPTKVDRSAAYMTRYAAKNVVAAGLADRCQIQVSYAIGVAHPVSFVVETFGTSKVEEELLEKTLQELFDFRPAAIIEALDLRRPIFEETACYGHFGREGFPWEATDRVDELRSALA